MNINNLEQMMSKLTFQQLKILHSNYLDKINRLVHSVSPTKKGCTDNCVTMDSIISVFALQKNRFSPTHTAIIEGLAMDLMKANDNKEQEINAKLKNKRA